MSYALRHVAITNRVTGESFPHPSYTTTVEASIALARLTFPASLWNITAEKLNKESTKTGIDSIPNFPPSSSATPTQTSLF